MYRIACKYEPAHPRMAGKSGTHQLFTRGAWRVVDTRKASMWEDMVRADTANGRTSDRMWIPCARRIAPRIGTLINPRKVVADFLTVRRECRA